MALINCPECGKEVNDKTTKCIHCGYLLDKESKQVSSEIEEEVTKKVSILNSKQKILIIGLLFTIIAICILVMFLTVEGGVSAEYVGVFIVAVAIFCAIAWADMSAKEEREKEEIRAREEREKEEIRAREEREKEEIRARQRKAAVNEAMIKMESLGFNEQNSLILFNSKYYLWDNGTTIHQCVYDGELKFDFTVFLKENIQYYIHRNAGVSLYYCENDEVKIIEFYSTCLDFFRKRIPEKEFEYVNAQSKVVNINKEIKPLICEQCNGNEFVETKTAYVCENCNTIYPK